MSRVGGEEQIPRILWSCLNIAEKAGKNQESADNPALFSAKMHVYLEQPWLSSAVYH